jgi:DNA polymerase-3 subunit epsilon
MSLPVLPTYYYLDHFKEMLSFIESTYASVLDNQHHAFIHQFRHLTADEQCLFVRLTNRRGNVFGVPRLRYSEIGDVPAAIEGLRGKGFLSDLTKAHYVEWLSTLKKDSLVLIGREAGRDEVKVSWKKSKLIDFLVEHIPFEDALDHGSGDTFVVRRNTAALDFLLYLYFGKTAEDLKSFALRDLGIVRTNDAAQFKARFEDPGEARACFYYAQLLDRVTVSVTSVFEMAVDALASGPLDNGDYARSLRDRAALAIGRFFEKQDQPQRAIECYRLVNAPECNERIVRLLYASDQKDEAKALLERMIDDPGSDDEHHFAADFYARKFDGRRTGACTELLRASREVIIDEIHRGEPEAGVAGVLRREQFEVHFAENLLWHNLFGLLFWDELFESGQLHSGFDWVPHCLKDRSFARIFEQPIAAKLEAIRERKALPLILKPVAAHWGKPNGIFSWQSIDIETLKTLLTFGNANAIAGILGLMANDFRSMRDGFPDLMLVRNEQVSFAEVKAQGDAVRRNQLTRLRQLQSAGFEASIIRADYRFDTEQIYVVVDIETTGGWGASDRITEIGAVKVKGHEIIDKWHSLINPQRSIPASITQLTGITNEMVRDAPFFGEVADSLLAFMGDSIFVAHNVNFDYGFIAQEFTRLDRRFRFPKFCTCAGMRRYYPGHRSYNLGRICSIYEISLDRHHRALCDAEAAAQLLNLINRKREQMTPDSAAQSRSRLVPMTGGAGNTSSVRC